MNSILNILGVKKGSKSFSSPPKTSAAETGQMSSVETGQMSAVETGQMSAAETGQMSAVETRQMSSIAAGPCPVLILPIRPAQFKTQPTHDCDAGP